MYSKRDGLNDQDQCPWCGHPLSDVWDYFHYGSHVAEFECPECEREISAEIESTTWLKRVEPIVTNSD